MTTAPEPAPYARGLAILHLTEDKHGMNTDSNLQHGFMAKLLYPHYGPSTSAQQMRCP